MWVTARGKGNTRPFCVVHVEGALSVVIRVHSAGAVKVVGCRSDEGTAVPVVLACCKVHERCVHHDGLTSKVVAAVTAQIAVLHQSVAEGSATG